MAGPGERAALADRDRCSVFVRDARKAVGMLDGDPGERVWAGMSPDTRLVLVTLGAKQPGDVEHIARQSWRAFSPADRAHIGFVARTLHRDCEQAACLK